MAWAETLAQLKPTYTVATHGATGGQWTGKDGETGHWGAAKVPGPVKDAYGIWVWEKLWKECGFTHPR